MKKNERAERDSKCAKKINDNDMTMTHCTVAQFASDDFGTQSLGLLPIFPSSNWPLGILYRFPGFSRCVQCDRHWPWIFTNRFIIFISSTSEPGPCFSCCSSWPGQLSLSQQYRSSFDRLKIHSSQKSQNLRIETQCGHERLRMSDPSHSSKRFLKVLQDC